LGENKQVIVNLVQKQITGSRKAHKTRKMRAEKTIADQGEIDSFFAWQQTSSI
jgi:hypothetical protein